ncbi:DUF2270 domain-containing protein [Haloferacaceae archaeon DSL9]
MSDNEPGEFDPEAPEERAVAADAAGDRAEFLSLMPHYYRGEVSQMATRIDRLDLSIDWAIAVIGATLALSFQSPDSPPYFLLIGMFAITMFLLFDVRRYRTYDAARSRVRMIEQNVFANAFSPGGTTHKDWRKKLADDLRKPTLKVSYREALSRRLERVYFPLYTVVLVAWLFRITLFVPDEGWRETAAVVGVPGPVVVAAVVGSYALAAVITYWPARRKAKGEFHGEEVGTWKTDR